MCLAPPLTQLINYTLVMDGAPGPDTNDGRLQLQLVLDPIVTEISVDTRMVEVGRTNSLIRISVSG